MSATGVPQYHRLVAGGVLAAAAPALLPESADERGPGRAPCGGGPSRRPGPGPGPGADAGGTVATAYDTVTVALRHGLETVDILRLRRACGAVLQSRSGATVTFLVPAGTSATWHLPGSSCSAGAFLPPPTDPRWVMPPAGADCAARPTDAWVLRSALCEAACTLTAGGLGPF
ncbi:hypothetical protein [Streptomyces sp. BE303]|uniref:hypothetical protein n=1 Tax=Streptomyces sp. BE303 TaxID=3002528 RepID=UPI002E784F3A|nr:hypothetical protein [Streptomyces sp. BE303]MED7952697.1 hypothetical protein [Streptomyces sp. BE303]